MGYCLKNQLKENVNNNNLQRFNAIHISVTNLASAVAIDVRKSNGNNLPMTIVGNGNFIDASNQESLGKHVDSIGAWDSILLSAGTYDLYVESKEDVFFFRVQGSAYKVDAESVEFLSTIGAIYSQYAFGGVDANRMFETMGNNTTITQIAFPSTGIIVSLESMSALTNVNTLILGASTIKGNLSALLPLTGLKTIEMNNCSSVEGDANIFADNTKFTQLTTLRLSNTPKITNKTAEVKALIEAAHPGITVQW